MRWVGAVMALIVAGCVTTSDTATTTTMLLPPPPEPAVTTSSFPSPMPGAQGIGDRLYPSLGNGGYDVETYDIRISFEPESGERGWASGSVTITAVALHDLTQFNLDFVGMNVTNVFSRAGVDQLVLPYRREGRELIIDPDGHIPTGTRFSVWISWTGSPGTVPQGPAPFAPGWQQGADSYYVFSQPDGAAGWFPANDHPQDRANIFLQVEVPAPYQIVAAGSLITSREEEGRRLLRYRLSNVAPYQIPLAIGHFERRVSFFDGRTYVVWFDADLADDSRLQMFELQGEMTRFFEKWFGAYPYETVGALVVEDELPGALETVELATYTSLSLQAGHEIVAHEISHQWFGNWITLDQWDDIWLNEGLATFAQWLWLEHHEGLRAYESAIEEAYRRLSGLNLVDQGVSADEARRRVEDAFPPPGRPRADDLFNASVYLRGGLAFVALRDAIGDDALRAFLQHYVQRFGGRGVTEDDFHQLLEEHFGDEAVEQVMAWSAEPHIPAFRELSPP